MRYAIYIPVRREKCGNYIRALERVGARARFDGVPEDCAGLLLPGGGDMEPWRYGQTNTASRNLDPARDALELELLDRFTALRKPVLGICRGMQSINVFFGGTLSQDIPGHTQIDGVDRLHAVRTAPGVFAALGAECVNSAHHQALERTGGGLRVEQWAADGVIEAICHERLPVWGVQWHPERLDALTGEQRRLERLDAPAGEQRRPERLDASAGERLFRAFLELCAASD